MYCAYCGRLMRRCACHEPASHLARFMARGERAARLWRRNQPYKRAVPPQVKRRERQISRVNRDQWRRQLAQQYGDVCANCGVSDSLALDHIIPIAKGGHSRLENLQLLCAECNRLKGKLVIDCRDFAV